MTTIATHAGYTPNKAAQYISGDADYGVARAIAEAAPGLYVFADTGYLYEGHAPCGCYVSYDCRYEDMVGVCAEHALAMRQCVDGI